MDYRHTQIGIVIIVAQAFVLLHLAYTVMRGKAIPVVVWIVSLILVSFFSLTVEIKDDLLRVWFGPGFIRRQILLKEIVAARIVRNPWYSGWGIRWMPTKYWLWNVSGFDAVELELKNGKRFRIGTDEPDLLVQAIQNTNAIQVS
ncbi:MAG: hypothetical protein HY961_15155 [Ignavibacteriae bacterium]|nr:hypothetical protein [Ignavibacteriota bacterium]